MLDAPRHEGPQGPVTSCVLGREGVLVTYYIRCTGAHVAYPPRLLCENP